MRVVLRTLSNLNRLAICTSLRAFTPLYKAPIAVVCARPLSLQLPSQALSSPRALSTASGMSESTFYNLKAELPNGSSYDFEQLKGKVVLVVNVASKWHSRDIHTFSAASRPNTQVRARRIHVSIIAKFHLLLGLEALYEKYKDQGFVILGFPCNQFGGQEPGTDDEIATFCQKNHGVTFPLMKKSDVNGDNTNEVYKYLKEQKSGLLGLTRIKWNFEKFLIDKEGKIVHRWASTTNPETIGKEVEKLL
ncbi:hypothetical protein EIP86_008507 [Pleurotus ostreatoroseus]|nr:hypothetical protein EIP86_008507 [Pleurotus ostreatoroseus]